MKTRTKNFLFALLGAAVFAVAVGEINGGNGSGIMGLVVIGGCLWGLWRLFVALYLFMKPVREAIKPQVEAFNNHLDGTMRRSGLGAVADVAKTIDSGIAGAVSATQKDLDERYKYSDQEGYQGEQGENFRINCPDCRELILRDARVCKHCGYRLLPKI